ncbi:MAG: hypothetical protein M1839_005818 [Geoglossum umbratile]|nr:MAG: hypothetical protein M1839_005818 [Geoglossum umbratile]
MAECSYIQESSHMWRFKEDVNRRRNLDLKTFHDLYDYSINRSTDFWQDTWDFLDVIHSGDFTYVVNESARIDSVPHWFSGVELNFAENILFSQEKGTKGGLSTAGKEDRKVAITEVREGAAEIRHITWGELRRGVGRLAQAMRVAGVKRGDRIAVVASNSADTLQVFLASASLGALFSSSSTDMGPKGILDRLVQIEPKYLFMDDWAVYNGKTIDLRDKMTELVGKLERITEFQGVISQPRFSTPADITRVPHCMTLSDFLSKTQSDELVFERVGFRDPLLVVYSSGTTGTPKCIVHSGVVLPSKKEHHFHSGIDLNSVVLQYTTTGWIMYLSTVTAMLLGASLVLYDGSPFKPDPLVFIRLVGEQKVTHLGISPRYLQETQKNGISPRDVTDLSSLQIVTSTGMVLSDALFEWFYDVGFPPAAQLSNISGGTDIAGCFALGNPLTPVYTGGCQGPCLGTAIAVYDQTVEVNGAPGIPVEDGVPGELVATKPFPNMPVIFWGKNGEKRYFDAYFARFDNVWSHGDFVMTHPATKQIIFLGRADGVLNPSGVRFGSSEIYNILEASFPTQIADSLCVGQHRPADQDERVILFLLMRPGQAFTPHLVNQVKSAIQRGLSPRHVPKYVFETPEIPTTVNLKKVELPVKHIVSGKVIKPSGTLLNPECLDFYYKFARVEELVGPKSKL